ncbi:MAG: alanine racemase [Kiritimatiellae bacterium]|nr:alanine racemase [Kiritimatiellia bacterium]MDW8459295.1 alanine racemase [Verrucomicrobiota bacterium]
MISPWVQVDLGLLDRNIRAVRLALNSRTSVVLVVKADAYGHGLIPVVRQAARSGVTWFAVAYLREAINVRRTAPDANIVILGAVSPEDVRTLIEERLYPIVVDEAHGMALARAARAIGATLHAHLKIDTGMGRFGVPWEEAVPIYERLARQPGLAITGLCTHFASVEARRPSLGPLQMERFRQIDEQIRSRSVHPLFRHVSSSRAFLIQPDWDLDGIRPGIAVYGYGARERGMRIQTEPVLQWRTGVMQVKRVPSGTLVGYYSTYVTPAPTTLAVIAVGYADGYHRALSNRGHVLIGGRRCAVVGRVSMNWIVADCGLNADVSPGDEVVLIGQQGSESIWADELARQARTIPYEILTSIHPNIERRYVSSPSLPLFGDPQRV